MPLSELLQCYTSVVSYLGYRDILRGESVRTEFRILSKSPCTVKSALEYAEKEGLLISLPRVLALSLSSAKMNVYAASPGFLADPPRYVAQWLWRCAGELEVADSIPAAATAFRWGQNARALVYLGLGAR